MKNRMLALVVAATAGFALAPAVAQKEKPGMGFIDAHCHVWTDDTEHYPLAAGWKAGDLEPRRFAPEDLLRHAHAAGVDRIALVQMSCYRFDNSYMLDTMARHKGVFSGTAVIDPAGEAPERLMTELGRKGVRAFRIYPGLDKGVRPNTGAGARWLEHGGYARMFAAGAKNNQALSCLINPDALPEVDRMCRQFPDTPVIVDHLCRIGVDGEIRDRDVEALCALAQHRRVLVKVGAFYALGKKAAPYTDLAGLIERVVKAFGPQRCMWESDSPFQAVGGHNYRDSAELIRTRLGFLSAEDREWLLRKTAERFFFP
jgi:predicted TIM-barrel fold metal-dependent hydrolase